MLDVIVQQASRQMRYAMTLHTREPPRDCRLFAAPQLAQALKSSESPRFEPT
jgi:hypothetical protein